MMFSQYFNSYRIFKRLAKTLNRLRICSGWSEALLVPKKHIVGNLIRVRILARILTKCELKKQLVRWYFLYLHFLASGNLGLLSVVLNLDINLLSSFLKCRSLKVNVFVFIHRKTMLMAEVYIGYNLNAQTHMINSPAWSGLSQSYAF